jgi:hypothetical protein
VSRPHLRRAEVDRRQQPCLGHQLRQPRRERRRPRVAGLELVHRTRQLARDARQVHAEVVEDAVHIRVGRIEQLQKHVLDVDVVVRSGHTERRPAFERLSGRVVQPGDQRFEICHI